MTENGDYTPNMNTHGEGNETNGAMNNNTAYNGDDGVYVDVETVQNDGNDSRNTGTENYGRAYGNYGAQNVEPDVRNRYNNNYSEGYSNAYTPGATANTKKKASYGIGALITAVVAGVALCAVVCVGIVKLGYVNVGTDDNGTGTKVATVQTSKPTESLSPNSEASKGLVVGTGSTSDTAQEGNVIELCRSSVVSINVQMVSNSYYYGDNVATSSGSGVIITADGYIVTCNHVVEGASSISIALQDGTTYDAQMVGYDSRTDLAIIKVDASGLPAATIADSNAYAVGDKIYAIGNPLGEFASTVTDGIISGMDRSVEIDGVSMTLMQTNAAINPGNSGGGLFSAETGELLGIVNAKNYGLEIEGLGFAIPTSSAHDIITDLMDLGYVTGRPYLGISMQTVSSSLGYGMFAASTQRVLIKAVSENSPAEASGVKEGDYLVGFGGVQISSTDDLSNVLNNYNAGDKVEMVVERNGKELKLSVTLGEASSR